MRVLLVANYEPDQQQSMQRYASWLLGELRSQAITAVLIRPVPLLGKLAIGPLRRGSVAKYLGYLDKYWIFPRQLQKAASSFDLVHVLDHSNSMYLKAVGSAPAVITCHDVLAIRAARGEFPQEHTGWMGRRLQTWILRGLKRAANVICVSHKTAGDLGRLTANSSAQIEVILNPLNWHYHPQPDFPAELRARLSLAPEQPYFLHVGGNQWYKNRAGVLRIFSELIRMPEYADANLIMAGKPFTQPMRDLVRELALEGRMIEAKDTSNEDLQALYSHAQALLFPSLEEGFGWPIAEAQACGCPVATTNHPPMTEVAGDAAILFDPADPRAAAEAIRDGLKHSSQLREAGLRNAARFAPDAIVDRYCAFYANVLSKA
jgi:glycosyltransferase involved in cell wall biosynthesis